MNNLLDQKFTYFISEKSPILIVTLGGKILRSTNQILDQCFTDVSTKDFSWAVLNFQGVSEIDLPSITHLAKFQKMIRNKPAQLKVCSLAHSLEQLLREQCLLRTEELALDLVSALKFISANSFFQNTEKAAAT